MVAAVGMNYNKGSVLWNLNRFVLAAGAIVAIYSLFSMVAAVWEITRSTTLLLEVLQVWFDFGHDQVFAYMLLSAESAGTTMAETLKRTDTCKSTGSFCLQSDISTNQSSFFPLPCILLALGFVAFIFLAFSSLLSSYRQVDDDEMDPLLPEPSMPVVKSFYKKLTATDISSKLHVRNCDANHCFPPLDMAQDKPSQELVAEDLHGFSWHFKHVFTGNPKRHVLTTSWKPFAKCKGLVAGDCIIFIRYPAHITLLRGNHESRH